MTKAGDGSDYEENVRRSIREEGDHADIAVPCQGVNCKTKTSRKVNDKPMCLSCDPTGALPDAVYTPRDPNFNKRDGGARYATATSKGDKTMEKDNKITITGNAGFPAHDAEVFHTAAGTPYLKEPGVVLLSKPDVRIDNIMPFIAGFEAFGIDAAAKYATDARREIEKEALSPAEALVMAAGQTCYLSFGMEGRTTHADAGKYMHNIIESGHGSVLEHANFTMLFYGIDRAVTHELVRHRAGFAFSQVSQRYVDGTNLRFVEAPEYQDDEQLHHLFECDIDCARTAYEGRARRLVEAFERDGKLAGVAKRDARKAVNQSARRCLPNETEAPIVVTGNIRAWRNFLDQRASKHADASIRRLAWTTGLILQVVSPLFFADYEADVEAMTLTPTYRKV